VYTVLAPSGGLEAASISVLDLRSRRSTILLRGGSSAQYVPSGHLVYAAAGALRAVGFDPTRALLVGQAATVVPQVLTTPVGAANAMLASDGTLVYVAGNARSGDRTLDWVDRQGHETPITAPAAAYFNPRLSPDGMRIAMMANIEGGVDIWLWDVVRTGLTRVTLDPADDANPVWTPDGRVVFSSARSGGAHNLFIQAADSTSGAERLTDSKDLQFPTAVSPDGASLIFTDRSPTTGEDVMALRLDGPRKVLPLVQTPFDERNGIVSPDGRWLAYEANDTGAFEIYVRPFPNVTKGRWKVSTNGGTQPLWAHSGQELFYFAPDGALMRVAVSGGPAWTPGAPTKLLEARYVVRSGGNTPRNYDIAADGQRFLLLKAGGSDAAVAPPQIVVVEHFDEELKRLVPTK